jgi:hypothetical protein
VPEVDDDQLAALRRLGAAFGPIEVVEVISHDSAAAPDESIEGARGWRIRLLLNEVPAFKVSARATRPAKPSQGRRRRVVRLASACEERAIYINCSRCR